MYRIIALFFLCFLMSTAGVFAGQADVLKVKINKNNNVYQFSVTVRHDDAGWEHYADKWDVVAPDGAVLATRTLYHP